MKTILEAKGLNKVYGSDQKNTVLKNVNLEIVEGEFVSVMGPSGSGKSTLLYNISGLDQMTAGTVILEGQDVSFLSEKDLSRLRLHKIGFIFQQIHLLKNLSIFDNIILSAYLAKEDSRKEINKRAIELMKQTDIAELADHDITQASGGQLQRVAICRALINNPPIIFGDEPTGALNSKAAGEIMDILANINDSGTTILLVTHDIKVAAKTERVIYMLDGQIVSEKQLGKYKKEVNNIKEREAKLSKWLSGMGF
ncbi:ABC transporter ATP-binding protein [Anaerobacillus alkalidiazotrophicus]|uniref:ABC transporter ATP-binding protein n=1 Tax=Anaerobacillus alkalidiazotrophicus TaxID=472963 RepID=A0A1S2MAB6_9BACI|nr:ABC transporter ATP-binding protein [Anaerobacillus alkalidiazotrophicus]OIJ21520.1 ABC transporter ATP-binding protein [Anaerobacillus alkalidiazotrophicus]